MKQKSLCHTAIVALMLAGVFPAVALAESHGSQGAHWSYDGDTGPSHWGDLDAEAAKCKTGKQQSPIDLPSDKATGAGMAFAQYYGTDKFTFVNNGHTIQANASSSDNTLEYAGNRYVLKQFHFHAPSEHTVEGGAHYPMELHFVHQDANGALAVVGVTIRAGEESAPLAEAFRDLPAVGKESKPIALNPFALLPQAKTSFQYSGSLTTPPCSEKVAWFVLRQPIELSAAQIEAFRKLYSRNNRPVQPWNGRMVSKN